MHRLLSVVFTLLLALTSEARGLAGDFDPSFGSGGQALDTPDAATFIDSIAVQPDDKIVLIASNATDTILARLDQSGTLDPTFAGGGSVIINDGAQQVFVTPLGIFVLGSYVAKFDLNGALDTDYGTGGYASLSIPLFGASSLDVDSTGRVVLAGGLFPAFSEDPFKLAVVRLTADGALDASFGGDGMVNIPVLGGSRDENGTGIVVQADDKIVVAGDSANDASGTMFATRYNSDGTVDTGFGTNGETFFGASYFSEGRKLVEMADGKLVAVGRLWFDHPSEDFTYATSVARLLPGGALDPSFAGDGELFSEFPYELMIYSVVVQSDGKVIVGGDVNGDFPYALVRFDPATGLPDTTFQGDGLFLTDVEFSTFAIDSQNRVVAGGSSSIPDTTVFRLLPDCTFNGTLEAGEECDTGTPTSYCNATCELSECAFAYTCGPATCYDFHPNTTSCDDGNPCTGDGACDGAGSCNAAAAPAAPRNDCLVAETSSFRLAQGSTDLKDTITWKWVDTISSPYSFGNPLQDGTGYQLCLYDGSGQVLQARVAPGGMCGDNFCWKTNGYHEFYIFKDRAGAQSGITQLKVHEEKKSIQLKGKGINLPDPSGAFTDPVRVQLSKFFAVTSPIPGPTECFESIYTGEDIRRSDAVKFSGTVRP